MAMPDLTVAPRSGLDPGTTTRRTGYVAAIVVNVLLMFVVNNLLGWGWPRFLTDDFARLLPWANLSFGATIAVNALQLGFDPEWLRSASRALLNLISLNLTVRTLQVFPFDFDRYSFDWAPVARVVLVLAIVAIGIGLLVDLIGLINRAGNSEQRPE
jgi:hypothetical protein